MVLTSRGTAGAPVYAALLHMVVDGRFGSWEIASTLALRGALGTAIL